MLKKLLVGNLIVFLLLLLAYPAFSDDSEDGDINDAMRFAENKGDAAQHEIENLEKLQDAMDLLVGQWTGNKQKIKDGVHLTLAGVLGTSASLLSSWISGGATAPAAYAAIVYTIKEAIDVGLSISAHSGYVRAMEASIDAVANQLTVVEGAIVYYSEVYDDDSTTYNGEYEKYLKMLAAHTGWTAQWIDNRVNTQDIDGDRFPHKGESESHKHFGDERKKFTYKDLPYIYECDGPFCSNMFRSPYKALTADKVRCPFKHIFVNDSDKTHKVFQCIVSIYSCGDNHTFHDFNTGAATYPDGYRNVPASLSPSEPGVYTAFAGGSHTANVSVPSGWTQIYWYLKSPSESGLGTSQLPISEDSTGSSTSASYTYSFPEGVSGDYVLTAYVYLSNGTLADPHPSYTVSVSLPSSTETTTSTQTPSSTPSSTPEPEPEPTTTCGGCSKTVSAAGVHSATCASGHSYWACKPYEVGLHRTRTCRLSTCGKSWERCSTVGGTPLCDDPWRRSRGLPCWKKE